MGQFTEQRGVWDEDGHLKRGNEVFGDTVHVQTPDPERDFVGSSTAKNLNPDGSTTNDPTTHQMIVPAGAEVNDEGVTVFPDSVFNG